jgi:hypothetical protein
MLSQSVEQQARAAVVSWQQGIDAADQLLAAALKRHPVGPGLSDLGAAREEFFGPPDPGSQRYRFTTMADVDGSDDGIVVGRFFIANDVAAGGTLRGDGRGPTTDPAAGHRFSIAWDTRTGEVSVTVNQSTIIEGTRIGEGPALSYATPSDVDVPAYPITEGTGGAPNNFVLQHANPGQLTMSYNVLNSVYPMGQANGTVDIRLDQENLSVRLSGDDYPDGEFVQYRPEGTRLLGAKDMGWLQDGAVFTGPGYDNTFVAPR